MTRIIAGQARGRRLAVPPGGTRPTADRAREGLFSALASALGHGHGLTGLRFLDLYAGSGAVGLEARSRGADHVLLVERDRAAAAVIRRNIESVGLSGVELSVVSAEQLARDEPPGPPYDVVFADPPYALADADLGGVLGSLLAAGWIVTDALIVVERSSRTPWTWPEGLLATRDRRYGEATLWYGRAG